MFGIDTTTDVSVLTIALTTGAGSIFFSSDLATELTAQALLFYSSRVLCKWSLNPRTTKERSDWGFTLGISATCTAHPPAGMDLKGLFDV